MIKIDLVTGFLGSGKTTLIKKYAHYLIEKGNKIGILENDFGAVNVDMMLLQELQGDHCNIETVAGACDADCHKRRFKTKLIAMGMSGYDRVIVEPSGIFDIDEFFDSLNEEPLDHWYEAGSVITVVDAESEDKLSEQSEYLLASQCANAGMIILSKTQKCNEQQIQATVSHINNALNNIQCRRTVDNDVFIKNWEDLNDDDYEKMMSCGYKNESYVKKYSDSYPYRSLYFINQKISIDELSETAKNMLSDKSYGDIFRIKGFVLNDSQYYELNATHQNINTAPVDRGQEIIIVIGENLNKEKISSVLEKA